MSVKHTAYMGHNARQEECLQALNHLFIDISRLTFEPGYEENKGGYSDVRVATLDSGGPAVKLVAAKRLRLGIRSAEPKRLAFVSVKFTYCLPRFLKPFLVSDWLGN